MNTPCFTASNACRFYQTCKVIREIRVEWASLPQVSRVFAFEPVSRSFELLNRTVNNNPKVTMSELAFSDVIGETEINISVDTNHPDAVAGSSSILQPTGHLDFHRHIKFNEKEKVVLETVDNWMKCHNVSRLDIIWLDMQGAEHKALMGAERALRNTQLIYSEVSLKPMYSDSLLYPEFRTFMKSKGFEVAREYLEWEDMGNVLFIKKHT